MSSEDAHFAYGYPKRKHGHAYITAEEAVGIGILTVILGVLLLVGCWYCRRRSGYRRLKDKSLYAGYQSTAIGRCPRKALGHQDSKLSLQENNCEAVIPNAPPAYEKLSAERSPPPPYSP